MTLLSDFFVATDDAAESYDSLQPDGLDRISSRGISPIELEAFAELIDSRLPLERAEACAAPFASVEGGEQTISKLSPWFVRQLAELPAESAKSLGREWVVESELSKWKGKSLVEILGDLSRDAIRSGRGVFLWNSL